MLLDVSTAYEAPRDYPQIISLEALERQREYDAHRRRLDLWDRHFAIWGPIWGPGYGPIGEVIIHGLSVFEGLGA